jgi:hypothetical protein
MVLVLVVDMLVGDIGISISSLPISRKSSGIVIEKAKVRVLLNEGEKVLSMQNQGFVFVVGTDGVV